ncbi:5-histidylcysteine sulfoxide synthase [Aurantivibrio plasticivorans]
MSTPRPLTPQESALLNTRTVLLTGSDPEAKKQEIRDYFHNTFTLYEKLFECLIDDNAYYEKATPLRHPLIFYYGHTAVFFINKLHVAKVIPERIDSKLESTVAIGVDEMSWDDLDETNYDWPTPNEVKRYRDKVREVVDRVIDETPLTLPITWDSPYWILMMGIEHERIHLETSSVLIRQLPLRCVKPHPLFSICDETGTAPSNELLPVDGQLITQGKSKDDPLYGWDNEYGNLATNVAAFNASQFLVSNHEFLEFVEDGGYQNQAYWTEEGWGWATYTQAQYPSFWVPEGDSYVYRAMAEVIAMPWDWPVDVNYLEAKAFCEWKSEKLGRPIRLPTEAEWYCLRNEIEADQPTWDKAPGNINLEYGASACPVNKFATEFKNGSQFYDVIGNVWQWTETPIDALPGFDVHPVYDDFSTPTFDGKHNLIKGGCFFSTGNYAIKDSRYAFRRHFFQHAGLRYVESDAEIDVTANPYETDEQVSQYLEFHYGANYFGVENFPKACAEICLSHMKGQPTRRALDIGCAVGRSSFELAREFDHVDGLDFSARFISQAVELQTSGVKRYTIREQGDLFEYKEVRLTDLNLQSVANKCVFMQGDACNLHEKYDNYDLVFAGNLLDRLYSPQKFLRLITERINQGGLLVLTSPYTWLADFTEPENWLGGFKRDGENYTTLDGLHDALDKTFEMLADPQDVPFVIRETARKYQHTLAELTVWRKR